MDPATLAVTSMAASGGGSLLSAFGNLAQGKAQSQMYQYQAGVAQFNQKIAKQNEDYALAVWEQEAGRYGMKARQQIGTTRAIKGASNLDVNSGSAAETVASERTVAGMDMATIRQNAARTAYGYKVEGVKYGAEAGMYQSAASNVSKASKLAAFGSLLSGVTSVSSKWLQASQSGIFGTSKTPGVAFVSDPNG